MAVDLAADFGAPFAFAEAETFAGAALAPVLAAAGFFVDAVLAGVGSVAAGAADFFAEGLAATMSALAALAGAFAFAAAGLVDAFPSAGFLVFATAAALVDLGAAGFVAAAAVFFSASLVFTEVLALPDADFVVVDLVVALANEPSSVGIALRRLLAFCGARCS